MKFCKFVCLLILPLNLIACEPTIDIPSECVTHPSGINPLFRTGEHAKCHNLPVIPMLNEFDKAVLDICGDWGSVPKMTDFRELLDKKEYEKYVDEIYEGLDHQVVTPNADLSTFKRELVELWFSRHGFTHVMCGQPKRRRLGGMHFFGRYLQAQKNRWVGRYYDDNLADEISDEVFTVGVNFKDPIGQLKVSRRKSYGFLHANEIILHATKAYKGFSENSQLSKKRSEQCLYNSEGITYVVIARKNSIVTFFPDLTPHCERGKTECGCLR